MEQMAAAASVPPHRLLCTCVFRSVCVCVCVRGYACNESLCSCTKREIFMQKSVVVAQHLKKTQMTEYCDISYKETQETVESSDQTFRVKLYFLF